MSRGGRGGGRGGRGGMRGNPLPFDVDPDLVDGAEGSITDASDENKAKQLFPVCAGSGVCKWGSPEMSDDEEQPVTLSVPAPIKPKESQHNSTGREEQTNFNKSVWNTGSREQNQASNAAKGKGKRAAEDAFDSMETYSKRKRAKPDSFAPMPKRTFPKMNGEVTAPETMPENFVSGKKKGSVKKSVTNKLANLDESKEDEDGDADDESVDGAAKAGDDDDAASEPQDSDFEEDEADDADNDYNAENYFSGGEGDDGSVGGEEAEDGAFADNADEILLYNDEMFEQGWKGFSLPNMLD